MSASDDRATTTRPHVVPPTPRAPTLRSGSADPLNRPAGEYLDAIPWAGAPPDPDTLDAATFLSLL